MTPLGETLRRERLKRNLELDRIAAELKISASMLKAIEEEHFDKLPGGVFVRSFVRQYARFLGLDEDETLESLQRVWGTPPAPAPSVEPPSHTGIPLPRMAGWQAISDPASRWASSLWSLGLVVLVMLTCAGAYAWWQRERRPMAAREKPSLTSPSKPVAAPAKPPAEPAVAQAIPPARPTGAAPSEPAPTPPETRPTAAPPASAPTEANPVAALPAPAGDLNPDAPVRVEVVAGEPTWISMSADGKATFTGVLEAAQSRTAAASRNVRLKIGNAAGVTIRLNGKTIGPFGSEGEVKTIQLTSGGFKIVPPEVPSPDPLTDPPNPL